MERQIAIERDWELRREAHILVGTVSCWLEFEQQLPASVVPCIVHTLSSAQLNGTNSTSIIKPVLVERRPVQLGGTGESTPLQRYEV